MNAGASFAIVLGAALFGYLIRAGTTGDGLRRARVASFIVAFTGSQGGGQLSPVRLTLAGVALAAVLEGLTSGIALLILMSTINCVSGKPVRWIFAIYIP